MDKITKKYSNDEITVVWQPDVCIHSKLCWTELLDVFDPRKRPWIEMNGAETARIIEQIERCPSGALSYFRNDATPEPHSVSAESLVEVTKNGPLLVYGNLVVKDAAGNETRKNKVTAFCRCGASGNKPFCDGTHMKINFEDGQSD
jgi:CDGSH-type Zn-finger protein/uncharacterized Fe-S cluster protein YjdI